jgi:hypothetical protein
MTYPARAGGSGACGPEGVGRHDKLSHLAGIAGAQGRAVRVSTVSDVGLAQSPPTLLRPLAEYEAAIGGGF